MSTEEQLDTRIGGSAESMTVRDALRAHWRVGRKIGRTIYAQRGIAADNRDVLIGSMDSPELARLVVRLHNQLVQHDER